MSAPDFTVTELPPNRRIARKGGGKGGGGGITSPYKPVVYNNTLRSRSTARVLEVLGEGPMEGYVDKANGWRSIYLDGTPVANADNSMNFNITAYDFRHGLPGQSAIPGFPAAEAVFDVGIEANPWDPIVRRLSNPNLHAVRVTIRIPALYMQENDGDINGVALSYEIDYNIDGGGWVYGYGETIWGKTMSPYERTITVNFAYAATTSIDVRVTRTMNAPGDDTTNAFFWGNYTEVRFSNIGYDDTCVIAVGIDAEDFPNVPQRAYHMEGLQLWIPSNYNPRTRVYTGDWDGTFHIAWTNNPAWVLFGLLTNPRWGLGRFLDVNSVDKWSFYEAARWNDIYVANGSGGWSPRFTCNAVVNTRQDAWTVATAVASAMLGTLYFANGTVYLVQDRQVPSATRLFTPSDVTNGIFDYGGTDYRTRYTAAAVTWNDPGDMYRPAVELVQDVQLVAQQGYKEQQQVAFGCTSQGQAIRYGRWLIYTSQFEGETVSFQIGLEHADLRPGEVVAISDPSIVGARLGGRLLHDDGADTLTLDASTDAIQVNWVIYLQVGSAADAEHPTIIAATITELLPDNQVRVSTKPAGADAGTMWMVAQTGAVVPTLWRIATVSDRGDTTYQVLATRYTHEKQTYVDTGWRIPPQPTSLLPSGPLRPPTDVSHGEYIYRDPTGRPQFGVVISWTPSADARVARYQLEMNGPNADYRKFEVPGFSWDVPSMRHGTWTVKVKAFDNLGRASQPASYTFLPIGLTAKPLPPAALYIQPQGGNLTTLSWTPTTEIDVVFYWIKWTSKTTGATWDRATTSVARVDANTTQISTPTRSGTFMIKTIDSLGQESDAWVAAVLEPQQTETSIFFDENQEPDWAGTVVQHWAKNLAELWLPPPAAPEPVPPGVFPGDRGLALNKTPTRIGVYDFDDGFDLGVPTSVTLTGYVEGFGVLRGVYMALWTPLASAVPLAMGSNFSMSSWVPLAVAVPIGRGSSQEWDAHIECRVSQDGATWGDWFPLKSTVITARMFEWRLIGALYDLATTLRAVEAGVLIEVPLRDVQGNDVPLDTTGHLTVTYPTPFLVTPTVQITARQSLAAGGNIVITASDASHFTVEHRNAAGAPVTGMPNASIDYFVQGYGGHA